MNIKTKRSLWWIGCGCMCLSLLGCGQAFNHMGKSVWQSSFGMNYHIVLYANDGHVIREWHTHTNVDNDSGGHATFYDEKNNQIAISGTYVIEQE